MKIFDISDIDDVRHDIGDDRYIADISVMTDISPIYRFWIDISWKYHVVVFIYLFYYYF